MPTWAESAQWYLDMVTDPAKGFNELASDTCMDLLGDVDARNVLDIGCGEGHIARRLARAGARVRAVDPVPAFLNAAREADRREPLGIRYQQDTAEDLATVQTQSADIACAVLVLHHVHDLTAALTQIHRVLRPGGVLVSIQPHPWSDHPGASWTPTPGGPRRTIGQYGDEGPWSSGAAATGEDVTSVRDIGWNHHTLATWLTTLTSTGFCVQEVREPTGADSTRPDQAGPWLSVPRFLAFRAQKTRARP